MIEAVPKRKRVLKVEIEEVEMSLPQALADVAQRPAMYFLPIEYDVATAFLAGFNLACDGSLLGGFEEWILGKVRRDGNLGWSELALRLIFPEASSPREQLIQTGEQRRAVESLFKILDEFCREKAAQRRNGE